jgi:hypothetical protein
MDYKLMQNIRVIISIIPNFDSSLKSQLAGIKPNFSMKWRQTDLFSFNAMTIHVINDLFLTAEIAKTLLFFKQLELNDQFTF